jgi:hypothetical protein
MPNWERIVCDDVKIGDYIARTRQESPVRVIEIHEGPKSRRLIYGRSTPGARRSWGANIRPGRTAKLWRAHNGE